MFTRLTTMPTTRATKLVDMASFARPPRPVWKWRLVKSWMAVLKALFGWRDGSSSTESAGADQPERAPAFEADRCRGSSHRKPARKAVYWPRDAGTNRVQWRIPLQAVNPPPPA